MISISSENLYQPVRVSQCTTKMKTEERYRISQKAERLPRCAGFFITLDVSGHPGDLSRSIVASRCQRVLRDRFSTSEEVKVFGDQQQQFEFRCTSVPVSSRVVAAFIHEFILCRYSIPRRVCIWIFTPSMRTRRRGIADAARTGVREPVLAPDARTDESTGINADNKNHQTLCGEAGSRSRLVGDSLVGPQRPEQLPDTRQPAEAFRVSPGDDFAPEMHVLEEDAIEGRNARAHPIVNTPNRGKKGKRPADDHEGLVIHKRMSVRRSNHVSDPSPCKKNCPGINKANGRVGGEVSWPSGGDNAQSRMESSEREGGASEEHRSSKICTQSPDNVLRPLRSMPTDGAFTEDCTRKVDCAGAGNGLGKRKRRTHRTRSRVQELQHLGDIRHSSSSMSGYKSFMNKAGRSSCESSGQLTRQDGTLGIGCLPDECLVTILKLSASAEERSSVLARRNPCLSLLPLVCKRWARLLNSPSDVWDRLVVDKSVSVDVPAMTNWFANRCTSIHSIEFTNECGITLQQSRSPIDESGDITRIRRDAWSALLSSLDAKTTSQWRSISVQNAEYQQISHFFFPLVRDRFEGLSCLSLSGLQTLPKRCLDDIAELPALETLSLSFDKLDGDEVPPFEGCDPGTIAPEIFRMNRLKSLAIICKCTSGIPEQELNRLTELEELRLGNFRSRQSFPALFGMPRLRTLRLEGSTGFFGKDIISGGISMTERMFIIFKSLANLQELVIDGCGIREIPMAGGNLASPSLKKLSMNYNPDMVFKKGLGLFQGLEHLSMRRCNMPCISSAVTSLANLKFLDISSNGLVECHNLGKLKKLKTLIASDNPFPSIPRDVFGIHTLRKLNLSGCMYLEFNSSMEFMMDAWPLLKLLDLRKKAEKVAHATGEPAYQASSKSWMGKLKAAWTKRGETDGRSCELLF
jgi:Leucine-rich repeat (LRR) protein